MLSVVPSGSTRATVALPVIGPENRIAAPSPAAALYVNSIDWAGRLVVPPAGLVAVGVPAFTGAESHSVMSPVAA